MKIAIGSDHGGFKEKEELKKFLKENGHDVTDVGTYSAERCDYTDFALLTAQHVASKKSEIGIIVKLLLFNRHCKANINKAKAKILVWPHGLRLGRADDQSRW